MGSKGRRRGMDCAAVPGAESVPLGAGAGRDALPAAEFLHAARRGDVVVSATHRTRCALDRS